MELIYKLNLPELAEILIDTSLLDFKVAGRGSRKSDSITLAEYRNPALFVLPEFLNINNYGMNYSLVFLKFKGFTGVIHKDGINSHHVWAINFIHGGTGIMEYWLDDQLTQTRHKLDNNSPSIEYTTTQPAFKRYVMQPGAYLVNTSVAHRATGYDRIAVSLRSTPNGEPISWSKIVHDFSSLIIT